MLKYGGRKTPTVEMRCPKCGSAAIKKNKNQEYLCSKCGETFYFVIPKCGSQLDLKRYTL
jgi:ribosomal protein S27AE